MTILGINGLGVMPSAALLIDGKLVAMSEEERFTRVKGAFGTMPGHAAAFCLRQAGIGLKEVSHIAFGWDCGMYRWRMPLIILERYVSRSPKGQSGGNIMGAIGQLAKYHPMNVRHMLRQMFLEQGITDPVPDVRFIRHHLAHAASAYYTSGMERAHVIVADGSGEDRCTTVFSCHGTEITEEWTVRIPDSLGWFYQGVTEFLGFRPNSHEGKVMALAAYGSPDPEIDRCMSLILSIGADGSYCHDAGFTMSGRHTQGQVFSDAMTDLLGPQRRSGEPLTQRHRNIAFSAQRHLEKAMAGITDRIAGSSGFSGSICLAGGVALNCRMNMEVAGSEKVRHLFIPPVTGESGVAVGAALALSARLGEDPHMQMGHARWGTEFPDAEIERVLTRCGARYEKLQDVAGSTARMLAEGMTVGWFQGRMESGPRALGGRSILASPASVEMRDHINISIKQREDWRPFGASILYGEGAAMVEHMQEAPFMNLAFRATPAMRELMPAVVHVDGTTRPQFVRKEIDPLYWEVIHNFHQLTGIPGILNTSFNRNEEPLVCTPEQAVASFFATGLDRLVIGGFLVRKD